MRSLRCVELDRVEPPPRSRRPPRTPRADREQGSFARWPQGLGAGPRLCAVLSAVPGRSIVVAKPTEPRQGDGLWRLTGARSRVTCAGSRRPSLFPGGSSRTSLVACRRRRSTTLLGGVEIGRTLAPGRRRGSKCCTRRLAYQSRSVASPPHRLGRPYCRGRIGLSPEELVRPAPSNGRVVLVACAKSKVSQPAAAKDLYSSARFRKARAYAEKLGDPWFILSAEHGLVAPDEWLAPYERYLPDTPHNIDERGASGWWPDSNCCWGETSRDRLIELHAGRGLRAADPTRTRAARSGDPASIAGADQRSLAGLVRRTSRRDSTEPIGNPVFDGDPAPSSRGLADAARSYRSARTGGPGAPSAGWVWPLQLVRRWPRCGRL